MYELKSVKHFLLPLPNKKQTETTCTRQTLKYPVPMAPYCSNIDFNVLKHVQLHVFVHEQLTNCMYSL